MGFKGALIAEQTKWTYQGAALRRRCCANAKQALHHRVCHSCEGNHCKDLPIPTWKGLVWCITSGDTATPGAAGHTSTRWLSCVATRSRPACRHGRSCSGYSYSSCAAAWRSSEYSSPQRAKLKVIQQTHHQDVRTARGVGADSRMAGCSNCPSDSLQNRTWTCTRKSVMQERCWPCRKMPVYTDPAAAQGTW